MTTSNNHLFQCPPTTDRRWRGTADHPAPNCPRCASPQTKFCYYNNYSLSQPRYFCKGCRRYWTKGGSLRNVPVGGGCRKTRRSRSNKTGSTQRGLGPSPTLDSSGGPNIDLALVFANFLNHQDDTNTNANNNNATPSSEGSHDSLTSSSYGFETLNQKDLIQEEDQQGFISPELASFDNIIEDVFWPDESNLSGLTWQPAAHLQDYDSPLMSVEQFKGSENLLSCDNWSFFDTAGF